MGRPSSSVTATDGNMGLVAASPGQTQVKLGPCSAGPLNTLVFPSSKAQLVATFGSGPTVDAAALAMDYPGRGGVGVCRCAASVAGVAGSVTKTDPATATGTPAFFGGALISPTANVNGLLVASKVAGVTFSVVVAGNSTTLSVPALVGGSKAVVVNSATDGGGTATSDATAIAAALLAVPTVAALIDATALGTGAAVVGAVAAYALDKGALTLAPKAQGVRTRVQVSGNSTALDATVSGSDVTLVDSTSAGGLPTGTASQHLAKIAAVAGVAALVTPALVGDGTGLLAAAAFASLQFGSTGAVSVAGDPLDAYEVRVRAEKAGAVNVGSFRYSLDGGDVYSDEYTIPLAGTFAIPGTGLTLTFSGVFAASDLFSFDCAAPSATNGDLQAALVALLVDTQSYGLIHVVGAISPTIFASLGVAADSFEAANRFLLIVCEVAGPAPGVPNTTWATALRSTWAASGHKRLALCAGMAETVAPLSTPQAGRTMRRNVAYALTARAGARPISEDLGRVLTGPTAGVASILQDDVADSLIDARFSCLYSLPGYTGFFGAGLVFAPTGSDFRDWQDVRVLSEAMRLGYLQQTRYLSETVRPRLVAAGVYPAGTIDPGDAHAIEDVINETERQQLVTSTPQLAADVAATVDRGHVMTGDRTLLVNYQVTMLITLKKVTGTAGLRNVALALGGV